MGNEGSKLKGLIIDKNAIEANDFWALYNAECPTSSNEDGGHQLLSIFQGESIVKGQLWLTQGPMERAIRNLMIYRHPYILKYVTTWEESGRKYLATERVRPLSDVLNAQGDIQVCLGLRTILCSLIFLVEKAMARHLNISIQSIYVTDNGSWRLAGFEYVWKTKDVNPQLMELARGFRHQAAIDDTAEDKLESIEQYAFATLCEQILNKCKNENSIPHAQEFRNYCVTHLKHKNVEMRPKLSAVLLHPYFNHEFVLIHSFLFELPLKSVQERQQFFTSLIDRLRYFNEQMVASELATSLLTRMVLLDATAQLCVTPYLLRTKTEHSAALFSQQTYTEYMLPKILQMFRLRDAQIRLILLEYFMEYVRLLSDEQLQIEILPHLLAGMNDTNDVLVAKTLRCMADLVPILGATAVVGGQRIRIFSDGRPHAAVSDTTSHWVEPRSITPVMNGSNAIVDLMVTGSPIPQETDINGSFNSLPQLDDNLESISLTLRPSPDGGEDEKIAVIADCTVNNIEEINDMQNYQTIEHITVNSEEDAWLDWDNTDELQRLSFKNAHPENANSNDFLLTSCIVEKNSISLISAYTGQTSNFHSDVLSKALATTPAKTRKGKKIEQNIDDFSSLDIQVQRVTNVELENKANEFDFFKDMEPIIEKKTITNFTQIPFKAKLDDEVEIDASRFAAAVTTNSTHAYTVNSEDGWGVDDDDAVIWSTNT